MTYISDGFVDGFESRLLLVVIHAPVAVNHCDPMLIGALAVVGVHAVIRTVIPLTVIHVQALCIMVEKRSKGGDIYKNYENKSKVLII